MSVGERGIWPESDLAEETQISRMTLYSRGPKTRVLGPTIP